GTLCALSFGCLNGMRIFGFTLFDLFDYVSSNLLLPVGGMLISVFAGWYLDRKVLGSELAPSSAGGRAMMRIIVFCMRYVAPVCILAVFLAGIGVF
ncbi:MAG: sodium-dependent transporter, partial [Muribaculaceae bacterium]|nr:sodium-dependent transporter [Muribaculaceae bacterium]